MPLVSAHALPLTVEAASLTSDFLVADGSCPKIRQLLSQALVPVLWLDNEREPLQAITDALAHRRKQGLPVQTLHWVSHGQPGVLQVGQKRVDRAALLAASDQLSHWQVDQLALWACDYGADSSTLSLWEELVGASVFSSSGILGVNSQGRKNWTLHSKKHSKTIDWPLQFGDSNNWKHQLATVSYATFSEGPQASDPLTSSEQITAVGYTSDAYTSYVTGLVEGTFDAITNLDYTNSEADYSFLDSTIEADLIYIVFPDSVPTTSQLNNLKQFVEEGGTLLISGEWSPSFDTVNANASQILNHIGSSIAVKQGIGSLSDSTLNASPPTGTTDIVEIGNYDITSGLDTVKTATFGALEIDNESAEAILVTSADATNNIVMAREAVGSGNAIVFADVNMFQADNNNLFSNIIIQSKLNIEESANAAPVLTTPTAGSITETAGSSDTTTSGLTGTLSASDADGDTLTYGITGGTVASGTSTLAGTYGSLAVNTTTGAYTYTATSAAVEALCAGAVADPFTVSVTDGTATTTSTYTVNITGADDSAVISGDVTGTGAEDTSAITGTLSATDVEGLADNTYFTVSTTPSQGTASIDEATGAWSYTPNAHANGSDSFTVTITDDCGGTTTQAIGLTIAAAKDTWSFSNDYLEEQTSADLDGSGVIGDGTPGNATAPAGLSSATYTAGDDYLAEGTLASTAALNAVKSFFSNFNTTQGITFDATSAYKYTNVAGTAANLKALSSTDLGNITSTLTISDSLSSPTSLSDLQSIKANFSGTSFSYYGIQGTTKELADARNDSGYDWIKNITAQNGAKSFTLTDLGLNATHQAALIGTGADALDNTYLITQNGLTSNSTAYLGAVSGTSLAYSSDATPDATTSYLVPVTESSSPYTNHVIGLANTASPNPSTFADFNVTGDDAASGLSLTTHFYGGEQLSHISLSGGDLSTTNGYSYQQTAGSGTSSVSDDIWTLSLNLTPGQPSISGSVADNSNSSILGLILHTIGSSDVGTANDLGASVFRTGAWWNDISANDPTYKFSDNCPGININGSNGNAIDFNFYLNKNYLERTFSVDFDAIDGGFAASGLSSVSSANESTGTYIDVRKSGAISSLKLPVTISDVSANTAGGSTDLYQVAFSNDSWSKGNLSLVYGPSVASTITGVTSGSGAEDTSAISGDLNATDPQGLTDSTYFSIETGNGPTNGSASINAETGAWSYTPTANFNGTDAFTVTITDDLGGTTTQAIELTITAVDDSAVVSSGTSGSGAEDTTITGTLNASDAEGLTDGSVFTVSSDPSNGSASINAETGAWSYTPTANFNGTDAFTVTITDDLGGTTTQAIELTITAVDDSAVVSSGTSGSGAEDTTITGTLNASDAEGLTDGSVFTVSSDPSNGTASIDPASGEWSYTPTANFNGSDAFTVTITDDLGGTTTQAIALTITPAPTPEPDTDTGFIIVTPTPSASDDDETSETNSQEAVESQTITNTSSTETGSAALVENSGNNDNLVTATLPPGVTITSEGSAVAQSTNQAQESLAQAISERETSAAGEENLIQQVEKFINKLPSSSTLDVRTITPTSVSAAPGQPVVITGTIPQTTSTGSGSSSNSESNTQTEAFVIDLTQMPSAEPTQLQLHSIHFAVIFGSAVITGGTGSNVLIADNAPQRIVLGEDDDTLDGGGGNDTIGSAAGNDLIIGRQGDDSMFGGIGDDYLRGGIGNDTLLGGGGNDVLLGRQGNDHLDGGRRADTITGGAGRDTFVISSGRDRINDFSANHRDRLVIPDEAQLSTRQRQDHVVLRNRALNIKTTLLNTSVDDVLAAIVESSTVI